MTGVVLRATCARRKDAPGLVDLPHVVRRLFVRMQVRMEAFGKAPMGACDLLLGGVPRDPQDGIRIG